MKTLLLRHPVTLHQLKRLETEAKGLAVMDFADDVISEEDWKRAEVLYSALLTEEELAMTRHLRWIHVPCQDASGIVLDKVRELGSVLVTVTPEPNARQIAETVMGAVLAFSKLFFFWHDSASQGMTLWSSPQRAAVWGMEGRILLQIGLGQVGAGIADLGNSMGMRVLGVQRRQRFHPSCYKTVGERDLHSVLPAADVVSICLPRCKHYENHISREELRLMKDDSILTVVGAAGGLDELALAEALAEGKFRGVFLDNAAPDSPLRGMPRVLATPQIASLPHGHVDIAFRQLRNNLRHFLHSNYHEMKQLVDWSLY